MEWPPRLPKGFPLTVTVRGYVKKVDGKARWICGKIDPNEALTIYHRKMLELRAEPAPIVVVASVATDSTVTNLVNRYLARREIDVEAGELLPKTYTHIRRNFKRLCAVAGNLMVGSINTDAVQQVFDSIRKRYGKDNAQRTVANLMTMLRYADAAGWCIAPRINQTILNKMQQRDDPEMRWKLYTPHQIRNLLWLASARCVVATAKQYRTRIQFVAMILLAINGGFGQSELSELRRDHLNLPAGIIKKKRGKTGAYHAVTLWPETVNALRIVLRVVPSADLVFLNKEGKPFVADRAVWKGSNIIGNRRTDGISDLFNDLVEGTVLKIRHQNFYKLKHLHATLADEAGDPHATFELAGHKLPGIRSHYVRVSTERLKSVTDHIRDSLKISQITCLQRLLAADGAPLFPKP